MQNCCGELLLPSLLEVYFILFHIIISSLVYASDAVGICIIGILGCYLVNVQATYSGMLLLLNGF